MENDKYDNGRATQLDDILSHIMAKADNIFSRDNLAGVPVSVDLRYNIPAWKNDGYVKPLDRYRLETTETFNYASDEKNRPMIGEILSLFSDSRKSFWRAIGTRYFIPSAFRASERVG